MKLERKKDETLKAYVARCQRATYARGKSIQGEFEGFQFTFTFSSVPEHVEKTIETILLHIAEESGAKLVRQRAEVPVYQAPYRADSFPLPTHWRTRDQGVIAIREMDDTHLRMAISMLRRGGFHATRLAGTGTEYAMRYSPELHALEAELADRTNTGRSVPRQLHEPGWPDDFRDWADDEPSGGPW